MRVVTGSPGGRTIPNTTLWVVLNLVEFGLDPRAAVDAPRTHHQWFPDILNLEGHDWPRATLEALTGLGHRVRTIEHQGNANTIVVEPAADGAAAANPRRPRPSPRPRRGPPGIDVRREERLPRSPGAAGSSRLRGLRIVLTRCNPGLATK